MSDSSINVWKTCFLWQEGFRLVVYSRCDGGTCEEGAAKAVFGRNCDVDAFRRCLIFLTAKVRQHVDCKASVEPAGGG
jgi:hypothetical protein